MYNLSPRRRREGVWRMRRRRRNNARYPRPRGGVVSPSRVIVGFNVFGHDVGSLVSKAPEHSRAFRRRVRLYRSAMVACAARGGIRGGEGGDDDDDIDNDVIDVDPGGKSRRSVVGGGMDITRIRENRVLTKLLILAKRERVKEKFRLDRERLSIGIRRRLLTAPRRRYRQRIRHPPPPRRRRQGRIAAES